MRSSLRNSSGFPKTRAPSAGRSTAPFFTTPGVPAERVKALRDAFAAMVRSPAFLDEAKKLGLDINPVLGEELQRIVAEIVDTPKPIADRLNEMISPPDAVK